MAGRGPSSAAECSSGGWEERDARFAVELRSNLLRIATKVATLRGLPAAPPTGSAECSSGGLGQERDARFAVELHSNLLRIATKVATLRGFEPRLLP